LISLSILYQLKQNRLQLQNLLQLLKQLNLPQQQLNLPQQQHLKKLK
jgi:hypothetical protein